MFGGQFQGIKAGITDIGQKKAKVVIEGTSCFLDEAAISNGVREGDLVHLTKAKRESHVVVSSVVTVKTAPNRVAIYGIADTAMAAQDKNVRNRNTQMLHVIRTGFANIRVTKDLKAVEIPINTQLYWTLVDNKGNPTTVGALVGSDEAHYRLTTTVTPGYEFATCADAKPAGEDFVYANFSVF